MRLTPIALLPLLLLPSLAAAEGVSPLVPELRTGSHPGYGRVVLEFPRSVEYALKREGDRVTLHFAEPARIPAAGTPPRNVAAIVGLDDGVEIDVTPGATIRPARLGTRIVIDVLGPAPSPDRPQLRPQTLRADEPKPVAKPIVATREAPHASASEKKPAEPTPAQDAPVAAQAVATPPAAKPPAPVAPAPAAMPPAPAPVSTPAPPSTPSAPVAPVTREAIAPATLSAAAVDSGPVALAARPVKLPAGNAGSAAFLPLATGTGAAAFRRGGQAVAVFDTRTPLDLAALRNDPVFAGATIQLLPAATLLTMPLPLPAELRLARVPGGWQVTAGPAAAPAQIDPVMENGALRLPAAAIGQVVVVPDPQTGLNLLVGTQREPGQGFGVGRRASQFTLEPSWQGVVVAPLSDRITLRPEPSQFVLAVDGAPLDLSVEQRVADAAADSARLTRRYDFPQMPEAALVRRMQAQVLSAADAPPQSRAAPRLQAAQAMIALGMGAEAQSLLKLTIEDDPREAADPDATGLAAIAALLADRLPESAAIDDPALTGSDEVALWRAVRAAKLQEDAPTAAAVFANEMPLILSYPAALRSRLLPLAAETMALGGAAPAAQRLVASRPDDPMLAFARGLLLAGKGDTDGALIVFDALAQSRDQLDSTRAAGHAAELRLAAGKATPAATADALERQFYAWRGGDREFRLRLRTAALRTQAAQYRPALALLRETEAAFPEQREAIRAHMADVFTSLLSPDQPVAISPLDLVALAGDNVDVLPGGAEGVRLAALLADKLAALDLPDRAAPVLAKLMQASSGEARATYGARLSEMQLRIGDPVAASDALTASDMEGLPSELATRRAVLHARILDAEGKPGDAVAALASVDDPAADELRADIAERAKSWPDAEAALRSLVARRVPADGSLDDSQQALVLRLAGAASQAGDATVLAALRQQDSARMQGGKLAPMFRLFTADPVRSIADLPRSAAETSAARDIPASLQAMNTR